MNLRNLLTETTLTGASKNEEYNRIVAWLKKNRINESNYTINTIDLTVDVIGHVSIPDECTEIEIQFGTVTGSFDYFNCRNLKSLKGCPTIVTGDFHCEDCHKLTSLDGCPRIVKGRFNCQDCNNLTSLEGSPDEVYKDFDCSKSSIKTLKGITKKIHGKVYLNACKNLKTGLLQLFLIDDLQCIHFNNKK